MLKCCSFEGRTDDYSYNVPAAMCAVVAAFSYGEGELKINQRTYPLLPVYVEQQCNLQSTVGFAIVGDYKTNSCGGADWSMLTKNSTTVSVFSPLALEETKRRKVADLAQHHGLRSVAVESQHGNSNDLHISLPRTTWPVLVLDVSLFAESHG